MSSKGNIAGCGARSNEKDSSHCCPYCGSSRLWKHGTYLRKGSHYPPGACEGKQVAVPRSICRDPSCERTFSVLPQDVLPICRFYLDGLLSIADDRADGKSSYWIAKHRWGLSLRVVLRAVALIDRAASMLERFSREATGGVASGFAALVKTVQVTRSWCDVTRAWFRGLYPCRAGHILAPHKMGISRP